MIKTNASELDEATRRSLENLDQVIPREANGRTELLWIFTHTDQLARLAMDPAMLLKHYPADDFAVTVLVPTAAQLAWAAEDIRPYLQGFRVLEVGDLAFLRQCLSRFSQNTEVHMGARRIVFFETRHFVSDEMLAWFRQEEAINYFMPELRVATVERGIVHPLALSATGETENRQYGGVTDAGMKFVPLSATRRESGRRTSIVTPEWYVGADPALKPEQVEYVDEDVVFLGPLSRHYGHFILEGIARLWYFLDPAHQHYKAVYLSEPGVDRFNDLFTLFGISPERLVKVTKPTAFRNVIVPEQSMQLQNKCHPLFKETVDRIKARVPAGDCKKVYFSKEMRFNNRGMGEKPIEDIFVANGFTVFYPERLSMFETLQILRGAEVFVASSGTNAHNAMFLEDGATSIVLNRSPHVHFVQIMLDRMKNLKAYYVDANISLLPVEWSAGPFLFGPTRYLLNFLVYLGFRFDAQEFYDRFPKHMIEYFRAWGRFYNDVERKGTVEPIDRNVSLDQLISIVVDTFGHMTPALDDK